MAINAIIFNRGRTFWLLQTLGWVGYLIVRVLNGLTTEGDLKTLPIYLTATITGFVITWFLRYVYREVRQQPLPVVAFSVLLICTVFGLILSSMELSVLEFLFNQPLIGFERFSNAMFETTALLAWSALYFGYHYYSAFNEQRERALKAQAMAHEAQLKMLRYQLNPHFLFNTLNAISTLVLESAVDDANAMLTKLSSFLRYTLHNQPTMKVTLDQEMHTLGLYLDIERVRFQERLRVDYDIADDARKVLIPSLILQPLVENAIKYAIAPAIDGGTIHFCAKLSETCLDLALKDTGPGVDDPDHIVSQSGSGVGLVNTKERLLEIYGEDYSFRVENLPEGGLGIFIRLPIEYEAKRGRRALIEE